MNDQMLIRNFKTKAVTMSLYNTVGKLTKTKIVRQERLFKLLMFLVQYFRQRVCCLTKKKGDKRFREEIRLSLTNLGILQTRSSITQNPTLIIKAESEVVL